MPTRKPQVQKSKKLPQWEVRLPDGRKFLVEGETKSHARAAAKKVIREPRVPVGAAISRVSG